jgi:hypothetical protein
LSGGTGFPWLFIVFPDVVHDAADNGLYCRTQARGHACEDAAFANP